MITKQLILTGCVAMILSVGTAHAGPCNTGGKDAGSGPTPGYTGQTTGTGSADTRAQPPTETMNRVTGDKPRHRRMLKGRCRASPPPHSRPRGPSHQQRWPIKAAEHRLKGMPSAQAGGLPNVVQMNQTYGGAIAYSQSEPD